MNWLSQLKAKFLLVLFVFLSLNTVRRAQISPDSLENINLEDSVVVMSKSPTGAMLRSALLPGWGQIYNGAYWKAPIVWSLIGYFAYGWSVTNTYYQDYKELYQKSLQDSPTGNTAYLRYREHYRDQRDFFAFYIALTYFLNIVDAYVDAHLFDFDAEFSGRTKEVKLNFRVNF